MDVEKTIAFLLAEGARFDVRQQQIHEELHRAIRMGIRAYRQEVRERQRSQDRTDRAFERVAEQQRQTEASLHALMLLFERHIAGNGHSAPGK